MALPRGAIGLSAVCDCGISDHTHLLFLKKIGSNTRTKITPKLPPPCMFDMAKTLYCLMS